MAIDKTIFFKSIATSFGIAKLRFKTKNEGTWLGLLWYFLNPLFITLIFYMVFSNNLGINISNYPWYILIGVIIWNFFSSCTIESSLALRDYESIIKKVPLDKRILITSVTLMHSFTLIIELSIFLILFILFGNKLTISILLIIPIIFTLILFCLGLSIILSLIFAKLKDFVNVWRILLFGFWFLTPIFYDVSIVNNNIVKLIINLNPMTHLISLSRGSILFNQVNIVTLLLALLISIILLVISYNIFNKFSRDIMDQI